MTKKPLGKTSALLLVNKKLSAKKTVQFWADLHLAAEKATLIDKPLNRSKTNFEKAGNSLDIRKKLAVETS